MKASPKRRVIDTLLYQLRTKHPDAYRCHPEDPHKWTAACPACGEAMGIAEQPWGKWRVLLFCAGGCDDKTILAALADDPGDREHAATLDAQISVVEAEFARRDRARHARRELQAWQSTKTPSPTTTSTTTAPPPSAPHPAAKAGPSSPATTPASPRSATTSPRPSTCPTDTASTSPNDTASTGRTR